MKQGGWIRVVYCWLGMLSSIHAAPLPPLTIATDMNAPPFVMSGANKQLYGFDIDMMLQICKIINRTCVFRTMHFDTIIPALIAHEVDLGVGAITITLERAKQVNFSVPYLLSYAQFLGLKKWSQVPFSNALLNNKKIGIQQGSIFREALEQQGVTGGTILEYTSFNSLVAALQDTSIDFALLDSSAAQYWESLTDDTMMLIGKRFLYGYGFGIAVNQNNPELLEKINSALLEYQNNGEFQKSYNTYISRF